MLLRNKSCSASALDENDLGLGSMIIGAGIVFWLCHQPVGNFQSRLMADKE
jgi:hypothetical protein